jgi:methylmalonyl-CoA mutase
MPDQIDLFKDFPAISKAEWLDKITKDLKGKPIEGLQWPLGDRIIVPFLMESDFDTLPAPMATSAATNAWEISEDISCNDMVSANSQSLEALSGGVNAPRWRVETPDTSTTLPGILQQVNPDMISMHFLLAEGAVDSFDFRDCLVNWLRQQRSLENLQGSIQTPVMGKSERHAWITEGLHLLPAYSWVTIDGTIYFTQDLQSKALELANILADTQRIFGYQEAQGMDIALLAKATQLTVGIGTDYFVEIAKVRALQLLWGNLLGAYNIGTPEPPFIWAITSPACFSEDVHRNMIVATTQTMSAAIGGAGRITVTPSDAPGKESSAFSRRIARNVQHLLMMESYIDKVQDPAAGSYYVEQLTEVLAEQAWEIFCSFNV